MPPVIAGILLLHVLAGCNAKTESFGGTSDGNEASARIHGGQLASPGQFKSSVRVYIDYNYNDTQYHIRDTIMSRCTGTIISHRWILTASHCLPSCGYLYNKFNNINRYEWTANPKVIVGCPYVLYTNSCKMYEVESFVANDNAFKELGDCKDQDTWTIGIDVALLRLKEDIIYNADVGPATLMSGRMPNFVQNCIAQGFGKNDHNPNTEREFGDGQLYYVTLTAGNKEFCINVSNTAKPGRAFYFEEYQICTHNYENRNNMTCGGDSGSALFCPAKGGELISVGVLKGGLATLCGLENGLDFYTSTGYVEDWIKDTTNDPNIVFKTYVQ